MKTVETLFDTVLVKDKLSISPKAILQTQLKSFMNLQGMYHFKIVFNRVYFKKVSKFPKGIERDEWIELARFLAAEKWGSLIVLVDKKKANQ